MVARHWWGPWDLQAGFLGWRTEGHLYWNSGAERGKEKGKRKGREEEGPHLILRVQQRGKDADVGSGQVRVGLGRERGKVRERGG